MNIIQTAIRILLLLIIPVHAFANDDFSSGKMIAVRWTLQNNFDQTSDKFTARFVIINNSAFSLTQSNWNLYFNVAPRTIINSKESRVSVEHINGDWFRLKPLKGFSLAPGDSCVISYQGSPAMIKHNDAPTGLYFVFYDEQGREKLVSSVTHYTYDSFVKDNQIHRSASDLEPIRTPEWMYHNNIRLVDLPLSNMKETVPSPRSVTRLRDSLVFSPDFAIAYNEKLVQEAIYLQETIRKDLGWDLKLVKGVAKCKRCIRLDLDKSLSKDPAGSYEMQISGTGISIRSNTSAGVFYGLQTLRSYFPLAAIGNRKKFVRLLGRFVSDAPRFEYRGVSLDVARNFQSKETVLKLIDLFAYYKINRLMLMMADDEGWRIEIEGLPELTEIGGKRKHLNNFSEPSLHPSYGSGPDPDSHNNYGTGFFSRRDFIEIIKHARKNHIKVIPEFNLPAHAKAAIKAMEKRYERLASVGRIAEANEFRLLDPSDTSRYMSAQSYIDNTASVADSATFRFAYKVITEIEKMYADAGMKLDEIHVGGDEVPHGVWTGSPMAHQLISSNPDLSKISDLQRYYFRQLLKILDRKNLQVDVWDDLLVTRKPDGALVVNKSFTNDNVVPYIWNNIFENPDLAYRLANAGFKVVMCNVSNFYFDLAYNNDPQEPGAYWGGFVDTRDAWGLAPFDMFKTIFNTPMGEKVSSKEFRSYERLTETGRKNVLGVHAQLFSETIKGREMLEYYLLPKLIGFSETAWAQERTWETIEDDSLRIAMMDADWNIFANGLAKRELPRLKFLSGGFNYRVPPPGGIIEKGMLKVNSEYPGLKIFFADGDLVYHEYKGAVKVTGDVKIKCVDSAGGESRVVSLRGR